MVKIGRVSGRPGGWAGGRAVRRSALLPARLLACLPACLCRVSLPSCLPACLPPAYLYIGNIRIIVGLGFVELSHMTGVSYATEAGGLRLLPLALLRRRRDGAGFPMRLLSVYVYTL